MGERATIASTHAKIARHVLLLGREEIGEIGEIGEHVPEEVVGSSTMPHEESPVRSERVVVFTVMIRGHAGTMDPLTEAYDERDAGF